MPESMNFTELTNAIMDKNAGVTTYLGIKTVEWAQDKEFYAFNIKLDE